MINRLKEQLDGMEGIHSKEPMILIGLGNCLKLLTSGTMLLDNIPLRMFLDAVAKMDAVANGYQPPVPNHDVALFSGLFLYICKITLLKL